jgi:RND family efflux transporter MFP subunit
MRVKSRCRSWFALAFAALTLAACSEQAPPVPPAPDVIVSPPLQQEITDWDDYAGRFEAVDAVDVRPRVSGLLQSVHFRDGQAVSRGQLLFVIDPRPFAARLAQARAGIQRAEAVLANATGEQKRATALIGSGFISQSLADTRLANQRQAAAELAQARAAADQAALDLSFTRITAPVSGRASFRRLAAGNLVTAEQSLLTTIMTQNPIRFIFDAPEAAFLKFRRAEGSGGAVHIRLEDETEYKWTGQLEMLDNTLDRGSGTIRGQALVPNPTGLLTPGMFGRMRWMSSTPSRALLVPDEAILIDQTRPIVYVVGKDDVITQKIVERGKLIDGLRVIRSGIAPGDRVVISGMQRARQGLKVAPKPGKIEQFPAGVTRGTSPELGGAR